MKHSKPFIAVIFLALMALASMPMLPVQAWTYPDCSEDTLYELFGPRLDKIYIKMYASESAEWEDLKLGKIDMTDWPLSYAYMSELSQPPYNETIKIVSYGAELGYFLIDINNDNGPEKAPGHPNPVYQTNPAGFVQEGDEPHKWTAAEFRKALWRLMDRTYVIDNIWLGLAEPMTTPVPPAMGPYMHPDALLPVEEGGLYWDYDPTNASAILDAAGFVDTDGDGWRNFPEELGGTGENINLIFYAREDHYERNQLAIEYERWLEAVGIQVDLRVSDRRTCFFEVMIYKNFHLYTGGWLLGRDPDHLVLYQSYYYWHPGFCYNYDRVNDTDFDAAVDNLLTSNTYEETLYWAHVAQEIFNRQVFGALFVLSTAGNKAYYRTYTGGTAGTLVSPDDGENMYRGLNWTHLVNVGSYGVDSYFTFLNAYPDSPNTQWGSGNMTMRWGFKTKTMERPSNPAYAEWVWDWNVLGLTYDSLLGRDPYTYEWMPWLVKDFEVFTWFDPAPPPYGGTKSGVRFTLRDDVFWSDGTPLTAVDVEYSLVELDDELIALGFGPPWWYSSTVFIKSFYIIDPYNIEVLLDIKSFFAVGWIGGSVVLPKHIWKTLVEAEKASQEVGNPPGTAVDFWGSYVDPNVIGTGPYRFVEYVGESHTLLVANAPGSTVQTAWPGSTPITSPGYFRFLPFDLDVQIVDPPELAGLHKYTPGINMTLAFFDENLWAEPLTYLSEFDLIDVATGAVQTLRKETLTLAPFERRLNHRIVGYFGCGRDVGWWHFNGTHINIWKIFMIHSQGVWVCDTVYIPECEWFIVRKHIEFEAWDSLKSKLAPIECIPIVFEISWWQKTIVEDIAGGTLYDDLATYFPEMLDYMPLEVQDYLASLSEYPYKAQLPTCNYKVDITDVAVAARAFGAYPGHPRWTSVADIDDNYKVDISDIAFIAKQFGWVAPWAP